MRELKLTRFLLISSVALTACLLVLLAGQSNRSASRTPELPKAISSAEVVSKQPRDTALAGEIDRTIDESELAQARWGVFVMSLNDGRIIYSRNGDKLFTPASNMKIYTTAAALDLLGADYRWRTSVYADTQPDSSGIISGDLTLYGRGSPDLVSHRKSDAPSLVDLADQLYQRGVRQVRGNIVGDESYFRGELYGVGWQWNDLQWYFGAEPSALSINANAIELAIAPASKIGDAATLKLRPDTGYVDLQNETTTGERGATTTIGINRGLSDNHVRVWGEFPLGSRGFTAYLSVHNPALWAATLLKEALVGRGIQVDGEPRSRDFRVPESARFDPQKAIEIARSDSATLGEIVRKTNKESNNLYAELILRTLGKERGEIARDPDPRKKRGDDESGADVVRVWLSGNGIVVDSMAIRDGSGLSRLDLVTPEATVRLLVAIAKSRSSTVFRDSLPIAGRDGTLGSRLPSEAGQVFAKTGSLTYDHSLSGYAVTRTGEVLVFSMLCNDATTRSNPTRVIDAIAGLLVASPHDTAAKTSEK